MLTVLKENQGAEKMSISINVFQTVGFNPLGNHENNLVTQKNKEQKDTKQSNWVAHTVNLFNLQIYTRTLKHASRWQESRGSSGTLFLISPALLLPIHNHATDYDWRKKIRQLCWMVSLGFATTELNWAFLLIALAPPHSQWWPSFLFHSHTWSRGQLPWAPNTSTTPAHVPHPAFSPFPQTEHHAPNKGSTFQQLLKFHPPSLLKGIFQHNFFPLFGPSSWTYKHAFPPFFQNKKG